MNTNTMTLVALVACCLVSMSVAAPSGLVPVPIAAAPVVATPVHPPVVTAYSSQYVARNYNGIAVAPAVVPSAAIVAYPAAAPAPVYAPAGLAYPGPLVQDYLF
ncbi:cyclin-dependent kinase inhibitor 1C-like [Myzus persicae]|uniref:cyclin-dependent kinase inhibitor 1C-like n=1 Tax=Myzus persicae TaxID=13164 RepID=UPI000B93058C|nr:cyclin-dependent kinase inhibitor 1C-like [Myzus persicae]